MEGSDHRIFRGKVPLPAAVKRGMTGANWNLDPHEGREIEIDERDEIEMERGMTPEERMIARRQLQRDIRDKIRSFGLVCDSIDYSGGYSPPVLSFWSDEGMERLLERLNALPAKVTGPQLNAALYLR